METLEYDVQGHVARVWLSRPEVRNAFNTTMIAELTESFRDLAQDDGIRVVVLAGRGKMFSAGADVQWMKSSLELSHEQNLEDARRMSEMFHAMNSLPQPLVGRVHGAALGGGMGLMAVCDIVVAANDTTFGFTETKLGILPAVISPFILPKIGASWARALFLSAARFDAHLAGQIGLVHSSVDLETLDDAVQAQVDALLQNGPQALREAKQLVADLFERDKSEWREITASRIAARRVSPEGQEGLRAFLDKRSPAWTRDDSTPEA